MAGVLIGKRPVLAAFIWGAAGILLLLALLSRVFPTPPLESSILALLPNEDRDSVRSAIFEKFTDAASRRLVFLIGHPKPERRTLLAQELAAALQSEPSMAEVQGAVGELLPALEALYGTFRYSLPSGAVRELVESKDDPGKFFQRRIKLLYLPGSDFFMQYLPDDPLLLLPSALQELGGLPEGLSLRDGFIGFEQHGIHYAVISAAIHGDPFRKPVQEEVLGAVARIFERLQHQEAESVIRFSGIIRFAAAGAATMEREVSSIGTLAMALVGLLLLGTFRSAPVLFIGSLPIVVGLIAGAAATCAVYDRIHLVTLGFGSTLIGICVDYTLHYLCDTSLEEQPKKTLERILPSIGLGFTTTLLGFAGLAVPAFPGLRQMALFSAVGLAGAFFTVVCIFPAAARPARALRRSRLLTTVIQVEQLLARPAARRALFVLAAVALPLGVYFAAQVRFNDDIRTLQEAPRELVENDRYIREAIGLYDPARVFLVEAKDVEELLQRQEALASALDGATAEGALGSYRMLAQLLPSRETQRDARTAIADFLRAHDGEFKAYLDALGLPPEKAASLRAQLAAEFRPLTLEDWMKSSATEPFRYLWLGATERGVSSLVFLTGVRSEEPLRKAADQQPGVSYVNRIESINELLRSYRREAGTVVTAAACLILTLLSFRFGLRTAVSILYPPTLSCLLTLGVFGYLGIPVTLFHLVALILVLGIGIDYAIFFTARRSQPESVLLAVVLSALTTALSFGLLSLSKAALLQAIGLTVLLGVSCTLVFSLLCLRR